MLSFLVILSSIALVALCGWLILLILMQKPSANSGMGAALGGGAAESAFGGEAPKVLTRWTVYGISSYFLLTLALSIAQIYRYHHQSGKAELTTISPKVSEGTNQSPIGGNKSIAK